MDAPNRDTKLRVLVRGWIGIPHSYAIVNCFQLIQLKRYFGDEVELFIEERPYYRPEWAQARQLTYGDEFNALLTELQIWQGEEVDCVYSITYPYDLTPVFRNGCPIPLCVYYTSEFGWVDHTYFSINGERFVSDEALSSYLSSNPQVSFTAPSVWSSWGVARFDVPESRNRIIAHGVEPSIFKLHTDPSRRNEVRAAYGLRDSDLLLLNIGAMTRNKGIEFILLAMHELVNKRGLHEVKLLLKGTGDLYSSRLFIESYFERFLKEGLITKGEISNLFQGSIVFTDQTVSFDRLNDLYNAADLYISPYVAEGFNLTVLEALAAGLPVMVPETGSTREFINEIVEHGSGERFVLKVPSTVGRHADGSMQNVMNLKDIVEMVVSNRAQLHSMKIERFSAYPHLHAQIEERFSWRLAVEDLVRYLRKRGKTPLSRAFAG